MVAKHFIVRLRVAMAGGLLLAAAASLAHHSGAMFDPDSPITVEGVVKEFQFTNPHSWLLVDVESEDGTVVTWGFENEAPSTLIREGIRYSDLPPGTRVTITANPLKDGMPGGHWTRIVREEDGKVLTRQAGGPGVPPIRTGN